MTDTGGEGDANHDGDDGEERNANGDEAGDEQVVESHREVGVEFGELAARLDDHEYPATAQELSEAYGDYELRYSGGSETFSATFGSLTDTFESADEVRQSVLNGVGQNAVGRKAYTDRGSFATEPDNTSF
jgi:hypothetical protein